jgi:hypothetical protein
MNTQALVPMTTSEHSSSIRIVDMPKLLEGDGAAARECIERWLYAERSGGARPIMSMAAAIALANGWLMDDLTGRLVARVDVAWFLERMRARPNERPSTLMPGRDLQGIAANDVHVHAA